MFVKEDFFKNLEVDVRSVYTVKGKVGDEVVIRMVRLDTAIEVCLLGCNC